MERRKFIQNAISFTALITIHQQAQALAALSMATNKLKACRFKEITLFTSELDEQFEFYSGVLGFLVIEKLKDQFSMQIGESVLHFKRAKVGTTPFYHYAINIPSNKYKLAKQWLAERTELLKVGGTDIDLLYFDFWDAHAMYFRDPSGNIGELISRHTLDNDTQGEFGIDDLLCVSEIGTPVDDIYDLGQSLKEAYGLDIYGESMFIGDELGMYVAVPVGRSWYPENVQRAEVHPTEIITNDEGIDNYQYKNYPYHIKRK
ncbi:MAG: hypothetical protein ACPGED_08750 [Flavobacteriales bacterium]